MTIKPKLPHGFSGLAYLDNVWSQDFIPALETLVSPQGDSSASQTVLYGPDGSSVSAATAGPAGSGGTATAPSASTGSFVINVSWDSSVQSAPTGFTTGVMNAVKYLESQFSDPITINIGIGWGETGGTSLGSGALASNQKYLNSYSYSTLLSALSSGATSSTGNSAIASLPSSAPVNGTFWATTAQGKALNLLPDTSTALDGNVGFSSSLPFTFDNTGGVASGTYDFQGVAVHELTEVMGRMLLAGTSVGTAATSYDLLDLYHYSAPGVRNVSSGTAGYFSVDGGATSLGQFNTAIGGDPGDWSSAVSNNSFDAFSNSGVVNAVTANDLNVLDAIGWNAVPSSSSPAPTPMSVTMSANAAMLATSQTATGLAASSPLASITTSRPTTDTYTYTLGGADAGSFDLTTARNVSTLSAGASGVAGGKLYALTLTATDATTNTSLAASPVDVIVGTGNSDVVSIATLSKQLGSDTPTMVFGLAGNDTLDGAGMTGKLWLVGGAGADTLTGGSGVNTFVYGAPSESTRSAMDVINNFHAATDMIDLTAIGQSLTYIGNLNNNTAIGADSIGWQTVNGNTYAYINTGSAAQSLSAGNMEIKLTGSLNLSAANFAHH